MLRKLEENRVIDRIVKARDRKEEEGETPSKEERENAGLKRRKVNEEGEYKKALAA